MPYIEIPRTFYTPTEVAEMVGLSRQSVVKLCSTGKLDAHRSSGGHWRISVDSVKGLDEAAGHVKRIGSPA